MLEIEDIFSSRGKIRILKVLVELEEVHIKELSRRTKLNHKVISEYLTFLEGLGIVKQKKFGRISFVKLNENNPYVRLIQRFINEWQQIKQVYP